MMKVREGVRERHFVICQLQLDNVTLYNQVPVLRTEAYWYNMHTHTQQIQRRSGSNKHIVYLTLCHRE